MVALRAKAALVVETELARLSGRLSGLDDHALGEVGQTVRRVVDKLLHAPTVRIKELAAAPGGDEGAAALQGAVRPRSQGGRGGHPGQRRSRSRSGGGRMSNSLPPLRIGTRGSQMAMVQTGLVARLITERTGRPAELVKVTTFGDVSRADLAQIGGTGVFVSGLRLRLEAGDVDVAVHSLKDLPTADADGIVLAAVPTRDDPRDALVTADGAKLADLAPWRQDRDRLAAPGRPAPAAAARRRAGRGAR